MRFHTTNFMLIHILRLALISSSFCLYFSSSGKSLVSYEEGKKKGYHKLAKKIQNKLTKGKTL